MSCSRMWCAVSPVSSDRSATLRTAASAAGSLVLTPGGCNRKRKERSSTSGFSGNVGSSERCWSRRRTCGDFTRIKARFLQQNEVSAHVQLLAECGEQLPSFWLKNGYFRRCATRLWGYARWKIF